MADDNAKLLIVLEAQSKKLQNQLVAATKTIDRFAAQTNKRFDQMNDKNAKSFDNLSKRVGTSMVALNAGIARAFAGAAALRGAQQLIDASTRIENSLKIAGLAGEDLERVYDSLFNSAQANATPIESLVELYGRLALVQKELGVSGQELLGFTDNIAVALRVSGKSAAESSGALLQLSQALGGGVVRAEEFNSILEGALPIAQAAAAGLDEAGGSVARLRQLVVDGKVSSEAFFRAFEAGSVILTEKVANAELTISQGFIRLQNVLIDLAGKFNDATGSSESFARVLEGVATALSNLDGSRVIAWLGELNTLLNDSGFLQFEQSLREVEGLLRFLDGTAGAVADSFNGVADSTNNAIAAALGFSDAAAAPAEMQAKIVALSESLAAGETDADELRQALIDLGASPLNLGIQIGQIMDLARAAIAANGAVNAIGGGPIAEDGIALQRSEQQSMRPKPIVKPVSIEDYAVPVSASTSSGSGGSSKSPGQTFQEDLDRQAQENRLLAEKTALQATLNPLVNDYGFAMEKLRVAQELQTAATSAGLELTPALKATIDELATGYANASVEAARLAESQNQLQQIANDFGEAGESAIKGFISDLREGKSAADALSNAMSSILDSVIEIGLNALLGGLGGGGGLGSLIGGLFGFAGGGYTGPGPKNKPAGVVHAGEVVWSQKDIARAGGVGVVEALRRGYANGGVVGAPGPVSASRPSRGMHITVGIAADSELNIMAQVVGVADQRVSKAAPSIGGAAVATSAKQAPLVTSEFSKRFGQ